MPSDKTARYPDASANPDFVAIERDVLAFWEKEGIFARSVENRRGAEEFIFYDGPPFANGLPHYGHLLTGYVKDLFARYQTMKGRRVERRFGWDCHGLPAEMGAEKELGISGRAAITDYGIGKFNEHCRTSVMKYTREWEDYVTRQARWVDFKHDYKTMDLGFMESVLWAFKQLYDKGLVYEAHRVMPYSWAAETPLSNFETKLDNSYREREDKAITVAFELKEADPVTTDLDRGDLTYKALAWTTTPWTLPSNLALAVNKDIYYAIVEVDDLKSGYIFAASKISSFAEKFGLSAEEVESAKKYFEQEIAHRKLKKSTSSDLTLRLDASSEITMKLCLGEALLGLEYKPLFPYFKDHPNSFRILDGSDFVTDADGTGIVHMAPGFGEDDQRICEKNGIELVVPVDGQGKFTDKIFDIEYSSPLGESINHPPADPALSHPPAGGGTGGGWQKTGELGEGPHTTRNPIAMERAEALRKNPTEVEKNLWEILSGKKLEGHKFRRQQSIGEYIVDFVCMEKRLVIELDGGQHAGNTHDVRRTKFLNDLGYRVIRFWNSEVLENLEGVIDTILGALRHPPIPPASGGVSDKFASPQRGREILSLKGLNVIAENVEKFKFGEANERIIQWLKAQGRLIKQEQIKHNYPHCWRTDQPLIYRAMPSWYVEVTKFRDRAVEINKTINWIPEHIRDGQMGHMLATAPDWSISRNRFWGTPIPVWRSKSGKIKVFGSIAEIEKASGQKVADLHRPTIDEIKFAEGGEEYTRVADVFDCWFESGSMPFAQVHYPFENKEWFEGHFPADFITEYVGQTRGWFNTLIMLSTALFDCAPFKHCVCHGVVLDSETGLKYSKRLKNYKDPMEVMDKFGADALRWLMISSPVMRGMDLAVDPEGKFIRDVVRLAVKPIWNAYNFFCLYANADGVEAKFATDSEDVMDRYILAKCKAAVETIEKSLDAYDTPGACDAVSQFFDSLNNWYIRRNKERFWSEIKDDADPSSPDGLRRTSKQAAYDTLYTVLTVMCRAAAPLLPLTLDEIYRGLTGKESVHLAGFPSLVIPSVAEGSLQKDPSTPLRSAQDDKKNDELIAQMDWVRDVCNAALAVRNKVNIRVRQPLNEIFIVANNNRLNSVLDGENWEFFWTIVRDEVNIKKQRGTSNTPITDYATYKLSINNPVLGKRLPEKMKQIIPASKKGEWKQLADGVEICGEKLLPGEFTLQLEPKPEYKDRAQALSTNDALVILDTTITPELEAEGLARDMVRAIQQARKDGGLNVSDRIRLYVDAPEAIARAIKTHQGYVMEQTLAVEMLESQPKPETFSAENTIDDHKVRISFSLAA